MALVEPQSPPDLKLSLRLPMAARVAAAAALVAVAAGAFRLRQNGLLARPEAIAQLVGDHFASSAGLFVLIYAASAAAGIPTLPLNLAAGWLWGPVMGGLLSAAGATCGATAAFGAARTIFGQPLRKRIGNRFLAWAQDEFERKGWRFVAFVRLNPVFPTGPLNYLFGLTSIGARTYVLATAISLLPASILMAWIGSEVGRARPGGDLSQIMRAAVGVSAAVTVLAGLRYLARYLDHAKAGRQS